MRMVRAEPARPRVQVRAPAEDESERATEKLQRRGRATGNLRVLRTLLSERTYWDKKSQNLARIGKTEPASSN